MSAINLISPITMGPPNLHGFKEMRVCQHYDDRHQQKSFIEASVTLLFEKCL